MYDSHAIAAISAAFLASVVEVTEAYTIVLAVGLSRGWRSALAGTAAALALLVLLVIAFRCFSMHPPRVPLSWAVSSAA